MTSYAMSTQRREWTFSAESLAARRAAAASAAATPSAAAPPPSAAQLRLLQRYYTAKAKALVAKLQLPDKVFHTCALFQARASLDGRLVASLDARATMLTCLYLAAKAEESYVSAEALATSVEGAGGGGAGTCSAAGILAAEPQLLRALHYSLVTHSAHRALRGWLLLACERPEAPSAPGAAGDAQPPPGLEPLRRAAQDACNALLETDAPLLHAPGALGLAAALEAAGEGPWAAPLAALAAQAEAEAGTASPLPAARGAVREALAAAAAPPEEAEVAAADRAWKLWRVSCLQAAKGGEREAAAGGSGKRLKLNSGSAALLSPPAA